jgi:secreted trypsin-like serine protease
MQLRMGILTGVLGAIILPSNADAVNSSTGAKQQLPFDAAVDRIHPQKAARSRLNRIFLGKPAAAGSYPFQVALITSSAEKGEEFDAQFCGGALVDKQWVLTAAYCTLTTDEEGNTVTVSPRDIDVYAGSQNFAGGERIKVGKVIVHPKYDINSSDFDVALIQLARPPKTDTKIAAIAPASPADEANYASPGKHVTVIGWGVTEEGEYPKELREANVDIQTSDACNSGIIKARLDNYQAYLDEIKQGVQVSDAAMDQVRDIIAKNTGFVVTDNMICAGKQASGEDFCDLDQGGPLFAKSVDGKFVQVGIASWGLGCGRGAEGIYGVYTRLAKFSDWIKENRDQSSRNEAADPIAPAAPE